MQHKNQEAYEELLGAVDQRLTVMNVQADPKVIVTDFEVAAMQAVRAMFGVGLTTQGCFILPPNSKHLEEAAGTWAGCNVLRTRWTMHSVISAEC